MILCASVTTIKAPPKFEKKKKEKKSKQIKKKNKFTKDERKIL